MKLALRNLVIPVFLASYWAALSASGGHAALSADATACVDIARNSSAEVPSKERESLRRDQDPNASARLTPPSMNPSEVRNRRRRRRRRYLEDPI